MRNLLTISFLLVSFSLLAQQPKVPLTEVLQEIEDRFDVRFAYDYQLAANSSVKQPDYSLSLRKILSNTFAGSNLTYQSGNRVIIIKPRTVVTGIATKASPKVHLSGFIKDNMTGEPLENATLHVLSTRQFATTNSLGFFTLKNILSDTSSIEIKYLGYQSTIVRATDFNKVAHILLGAKPSILDPIVVKETQQAFTVNAEASNFSFNPESARLFSSVGQPDLVRSIQFLPGVDGSRETSNGLSIRGGSSDQNLVLFDGFSVFNLGHFFGTLSAFNTGVIGSVDLSKGGFGAEHGTRVSGLLDIESKDVGFTGQTRGSVGVDLMSFNALVETSLTDKVSVLVAARRSYTDLIQSNLFSNITKSVTQGRPSEVSNFSEDSFIENVKPEFGFHDMNAKVSVNLKEGQKLGISFYNSADELRVIDNDFLDNGPSDIFYEQRYNEVTRWGNTGASLNYEYQWSPVLTSKATLARSGSYRTHDIEYFLDFRGEGFKYFEDLKLKDKNLIRETAFRIDNNYQINRNSEVDFGFFTVNNNIEYFNSFDLGVSEQSLVEMANQTGLYVQQSYRPIPNLSITGGLRGTYHSGTDLTYLEPRMSFNFRPIPQVNFKGAIGRYYQFVSQVTSNNPFATQQSFWLVSDGVNVAAIGSNHFIGGVTFESDLVTIDIEGYYKTLDGLTTYALDSGFRDLVNDRQKSALYRGSGNVKGMDVLVSKEIGKFSTNVSYSLSYVVNKFQNVNNGIEYNASQDQRHQIKWVGALRVGKWEFSSTFVYGSGRPYTGFPFELGESVPGEDIVDQLILGGVDTNNLRIPSYHRLDLGMSYVTEFGKHTSGKVGFNFFNLYNHANVRDIRYSFDVNLENQLLVVGEKRLELLGFTPSLYLNFNF